MELLDILHVRDFMAVTPIHEITVVSMVQWIQGYHFFRRFTQKGVSDIVSYEAFLSSLFSEERSMMTFEGEQFFGCSKIMQKIQSLTFQKIAHSITAVDAQPMFDGGILISVLGQLKTDDDPPHSFNQVFVLKPQPDTGSFYVAHDTFRLSLHSM
ncbi:putative nuclear transport factor 2 [Araneus ventricosus]|uniref:Putative nuclear transport factor 2 n=1 Tax=Araneus ventricosus TaxID=182803 RepID=A0A4Y2FN79_ARAVE|nr:putative nuclear transport factor 2 [Araneus ventricosus]